MFRFCDSECSLFPSQSVKSVCHAGCAVIAAVTLRSPDNAKQVIAAGGADLVTQVMKTHANEPVIQVSERPLLRFPQHFLKLPLLIWLQT